MGGFFGIASKQDCMMDVFFGVDYHSHLGTRRGGMAAWDKEIGLQRKIHSIENSPFRTKFEHIFDEMQGTSVIGCISDSDPQPLLIRSKLGIFAITTVGIVNNSDQLIRDYMDHGGHFDAMTGGKINANELLASLISLKSDREISRFLEGLPVQYEVSNDHTILSMVESGIGISVMHGLMIDSDRYKVVWKPLDHTVVREIGIATARDIHLSAAANLFVEHVCKELKTGL